jgi:Skp family chaperone for outer membrane proteins
MRRAVTLAGLAFAAALHGAELKIAVIDFHRTFMSYKGREALQKELTEKTNKLNEDLAKSEEKFNQVKSDLETMDPSSAKFRELNLDLIEVETRIKVMKRQFEVSMKRWRIEQIQRLMGELEKEIHGYAEENRIDLVLTRFWADPELGIPHQVALYARPSLDITDQIIERLNRKAEK